MIHRRLKLPVTSSKSLVTCHGFTLIEAVIVLSIFVFLSSISWISLSNYLNSSGLDQMANQITALLSDAQSRAIAQEQGSAWGVLFTNGASSDTFSLFRGSTANIVITYSLRGNIIFIDPGSLESKSVTFVKLTGAPDNIFTITLGVSGRAISRVVEIDEFGSITGLGTGEYRGLVGYWKFDEVEGDGVSTTTPDVAGDNDGTVEGGASLDTGIKNDAMSFDGVDDYVNVDDSGMPLGDSDRTFSLWVKLDAVDGYFGLLRYGTAVPLEHSALVVNPGGSLSYSGHSNDFTGPSTITAEEWHHVVFTYSSGGDAELYLDGDLYTSATISTQDTVSGGTLVIGAYDDEGSGHPKLFFNGLIDDARIYNRALEADEVEGIYYRNKLAYGLAGYWKLDEGTSETAYDSSSNWNNGTLLPADPDGPTWFTKGKSGKALKFDGADDYISINATPSLNFDAANYAVSAWFSLTNASGEDAILGQRESCGSYNIQLYAKDAATCGGNALFASDNAANFVCSDSPVTTDAWHHIVGVHDDDDLLIYIDGALAGTGSPGSSGSGANEVPTFIGDDSCSGYFDGPIDEVRIYDRALSAGEVDYLYTHPSGR